MRDSPVTTRDDDNPVVITRCYRSANKVATPKSVWGCRSWSRPTTPPPRHPAPHPPPWSTILHRWRSPRAPQPLSLPLAPQPPPPCPAPSSPHPEKMECKEVSKFILENCMKIKRLPCLSESISTHQRRVHVFHYLYSSATGSITTLKKGAHRPRPTLSSEELLHDTLQLFPHPV
jgi:hypothetical protein